MAAGMPPGMSTTVSDLRQRPFPGAIVGTDAAVASSFSAPVIRSSGSDAEGSHHTARAAHRHRRPPVGHPPRGQGGDAKPAGQRKPTGRRPTGGAPENRPLTARPNRTAAIRGQARRQAKAGPAAAAVRGNFEAPRPRRCSCAKRLERSAPSRTTTKLGYVDKPWTRSAGSSRSAGQQSFKGSRKSRTNWLSCARALLIDAIGADTLADGRKLQRNQEHRSPAGDSDNNSGSFQGDAASHRTAVRRRPARLLGVRRRKGGLPVPCRCDRRRYDPRKWGLDLGQGGEWRADQTNRRRCRECSLRTPTRQPVLPTQGRQDH